MTKEYKILNLTMHDVTVKFNGETRIFPKSGMSVRCNIPMEDTTPINGVPTKIKQLDKVDTTLPPEQENVLLLVSSMVLDTCPERKDLVSPDTSKGMAIKDKHGKIIAVRGFQRNTH